MALPPGPQRLGPDTASLRVRTAREGVAARAGHDLLLEVTRWSATVSAGAIELEADPRSLVVREATGGVKPLTDGDRDTIARNLDKDVLRGRPIAFRSSAVRVAGGAVTVEGELTLAGARRPLTAELRAGPGGRVSGSVPLRQSDWGIKPFRGLMGALKVRDEVEVLVEAELG